METGFGAKPPAPGRRANAAALDFIADARRWVIAFNSAIQEEARVALRRAAAADDHALDGIERIRAVVAGLPRNPVRHALDRTTMEMIWSEVVAALQQREDVLLAALAAADRAGPGSLDYDVAFPLPAYYTRPQFHLQPGSFHGHPLAGYIYHLGTDVFFAGQNDDDEIHRQVVAGLPLPESGEVVRVLDLSCSIGQAATALKERFPQAEVWGIDAGAPMLRYAHKRAIGMGRDVRYAQRLAEDTGFPNDHFDLVLAHLVFHELPAAVSTKVVAEVYRILRPGGIFAATDVKNQSQEGPVPEDVAYAEYMRYWWAENNDDPYHVEFFHADLADMLRAKGFRNVQASYPYGRPVWPMRVGTK